MGQNVIELNGKRYDALTGALLGKGSAKPAHGRAIDGFVRSAPVHKPKIQQAAAHAPRPPASTAAALTQPPAKKTVPKKIPLAAAKPLPAHKPQHAKTLMRRAVHKPQASLKPAIKLQTPAEMMAKPHSALMHKHSAQQIDESRLARAGKTSKHQAIQRFRPTHPARPAAHPLVTPARTSHVPVIAVRPAPVHISRATPVKQQPADIFEAAIARATSHEQPKHKLPVQRGRRLVNTLAIVGTFLIIGGFIGYLNLTSLELRVASMQVGFHAAMPAYTPTGYALEDGVKRNGGTISLSFRSGESRYTITQQASDWNSQTLLDNTLALSGPHTAIQKNGQTIYVYGKGANAAWVSGGIRYDITGNADLTADEIATIATSL